MEVGARGVAARVHDGDGCSPGRCGDEGLGIGGFGGIRLDTGLGTLGARLGADLMVFQGESTSVTPNATLRWEIPFS